MSIKKNLERVKDQNTRVKKYVRGVVSGGAGYASSLVEKAKESAKERRAKFIKKKKKGHGLKK